MRWGGGEWEKAQGQALGRFERKKRDVREGKERGRDGENRGKGKGEEIGEERKGE